NQILTLDQPYVDASATNAPFVVVPRYYTLPIGQQWITQVRLVQRSWAMTELSLEQMDQMFPERIQLPSFPQYWIQLNWDQGEQKRVIELYPPSDNVYRIEISGYGSIEQPTLFSEPPAG